MWVKGCAPVTFRVNDASFAFGAVFFYIFQHVWPVIMIFNFQICSLECKMSIHHAFLLIPLAGGKEVTRPGSWSSCVGGSL